MRLFLFVMSLAACAAFAAPEAAKDILFLMMMLAALGLVVTAARERSGSPTVSD